MKLDLLPHLLCPEARAEPVIDYRRRRLDLRAAITRTQYTANHARYKQELLSSAIDKAAVLRFECDQPGKISFSAMLAHSQTPDSQVLLDATGVLTGENKREPQEDV
jgi:alpha-L-fucosidase 2